MTYKMSVYGLKTILITHLNKNPKLEEVIQTALENRFIDLPSMVTKYNSRTDYLKLASAKTIHELEENLIGLIKNELDYVYNLLPEFYSKFFRTFLTIYELDLIYNSIVSSKRFTEMKPRFLESKDMDTYMYCTKENAYGCLLLTFLKNLKADLEIAEQRRTLRENYSRALGCVSLLVASKYLKYVSNLEKLNLTVSDSIEIFVKQITSTTNIDGLAQYQLENSTKQLYSIIRSYPSKATIYEAQHVYGKCRELLALSPQVIDLLTLYLVNRYYEMYILKYVLPVSWVFK
ncbi:MAG: hypothetical protein QW348_01275 [Ignisphaera sp.]